MTSGLKARVVVAVAALSVAAGVLVLPAVAASHKLPTLLDIHDHWVQKPAQILYTGDGSGLLGGTNGTSTQDLGRINWTSWTQTRATGRGLVWLDDCTPDCASGTFKSAPVALTAFRPVAGHFTRLTLAYDANGKHWVDRRGIDHAFGTWEYCMVGYCH